MALRFLQRLAARDDIRLLTGNAAWLLGDRLIRMGAGLVITLWVVRYLGPDQFGRLSFFTAFVALFGSLMTLGLDNIVVRELVRNPDDEGSIVGSSVLLRFVGAFLAILISVSAYLVMRPLDRIGALLVICIATSGLFQALDVIDLRFQAHNQPRLGVVARSISFFCISSIKICLLLAGAPLVAFIAVIPVEAALTAAALVVIRKRQRDSGVRWKVTAERCRSLLSDSWPMILSGLSIAVYMKIDQVMLGMMGGAHVVGLYAAATKLSEIWYVLPTVVVTALFPTVIKTRAQDEGLYYRRLERLFALMAAISLALALPVTLFAGPIITLLLGSGYEAAAPVLAIHIWAAFFVFYGVVQGAWDIAENLARLALVRVLCGAVLNVALNFWLIPRHGAVGAAIATVIAQATAAVFMNLLHPRTRPVFRCQIRALLFVRTLKGI
jgi:polysaccharide transporter, PST family